LKKAKIRQTTIRTR